MSKEPVHIPIDGVLDLHTFHPGDVPDLLNDYFEACREEGIFSVRVVHGKGKGFLRERVHRLLQRHPDVESFALASPESGGWGATLVELKRPQSS